MMVLVDYYKIPNNQASAQQKQVKYQLILFIIISFLKQMFNIPFLKKFIEEEGLLQDRHLSQFQGQTILVDYESFFKQEVPHTKKEWYTQEEYIIEMKKIQYVFYSFIDTLLTRTNPIFLLHHHHLRHQPNTATQKEQSQLSESNAKQQNKSYSYPVLFERARHLFKKIVIGKAAKIEYVPMLTHHQAVYNYRIIQEKGSCVIYSRNTIYHIYKCPIVHSLNTTVNDKDYGRLSYLYLPQCNEAGKHYSHHLKQLSQSPEKLQLLGAFAMINKKRKLGMYLQAMIVIVNRVMFNPPQKPAKIQGLCWILRCFKGDKYAHIVTDDFIRDLKHEHFKIRCGTIFNSKSNRIEPLNIKLFEQYRSQEGLLTKSMSVLLGVDEQRELQTRITFHNKLKQFKQQFHDKMQESGKRYQEEKQNKKKKEELENSKKQLKSEMQEEDESIFEFQKQQQEQEEDQWIVPPSQTKF